MTNDGAGFIQAAREELSAYTDGGCIVIAQSQELQHESDAALVYLYPDQVPVVIAWLQELLAELGREIGA